MITGFSSEEVLHELLVAPRAGLVPLPDTRLIERPGWWQVVTPSLTRGGMNEVVCTELPDEDGDAILDATIATYQRLGLRFRWVVGPGTSPGDLADRLARRGLQRSESLGMARATSDAAPASPGAVTVDEVSLANVESTTRITTHGLNRGELGMRSPLDGGCRDGGEGPEGAGEEWRRGGLGPATDEFPENRASLASSSWFRRSSVAIICR